VNVFHDREAAFKQVVEAGIWSDITSASFAALNDQVVIDLPPTPGIGGRLPEAIYFPLDVSGDHIGRIGSEVIVAVFITESPPHHHGF
jgi:hypothetical protein